MDMGCKVHAGKLLLCAFVLGCGGTPFPFKKASYAKGSFGDELNQRFANHVRGCNIVEAAAAEANPNRDYIPADLWTTLGDDFGSVEARLAAHSSSRLLFLFPFTQAEVDRGHAQDPEFVGRNPTRALREGPISPIGLLDGPQVLPLRAAGTTIYRQSCSSYLNSAAQAGIQFGFGNVKAALNTEFNSHSNLLLFHGSFESPLRMALTTPGDARRYGRLLFWTNFYSDAGLASHQPVYLKSFRGTVIARALINTRSTKVNTSAEAGGSIGIFTGSLDVQAGFGEGSSLDASQFWVYLEHTKKGSGGPATQPTEGATAEPNAQFEPGPTLEVLQAEVQSAFDDAGTVPSPPIVPGMPDHVQTLRITGMPAGMCHTDYWEVKADEATKTSVFSGEPTLVVSPDSPSDTGYPRCRFDVHGAPQKKLVELSKPTSPVQQEVAANYEIATRNNAGGKKLGAKVSRRINVYAGPYPNVPLDAARVKTEALDNGHLRPSWSVSVPIVDPHGLLVDLTSTPPRLLQSDSKLSCSEGDTVAIGVQAISTDRHTLQLNIQGMEDFEPAQQPPALASRSCSTNLTVNVSIRQQVPPPPNSNKPPSEKIVEFSLPMSVALRQPFSRRPLAPQ